MSDGGTRDHTKSVHLPPGWAPSRLGELGRYLNGRGFKKSEWSTKGRPIIRIQDLTGTSANPNYFDGEVEDRHVARNGDFLISWAATLGAYIYRGPEGLVNQHIFKVETFINQDFHFYAVTYAIEDMYRRTRGTGMVHIVKGDFDNTKIPLPPLTEQARIADRIDELFTDLAAGVAALERVKRNLSRYRAAVLHAAVTGRLTEAWRKEHGPPGEPAEKLLERILAERRRQWERRTLATYKAKGKQPPKNWKSRYEEAPQPKMPEDGSIVPDLPKGWCWVSVGQLLFDSPQNGVYKPKEAYGQGVPIVRIEDFQDWWIKDTASLRRLALTATEEDVYRLSSGDLLINRVNSMTHLGKSAVITNAHAGAVFESNMMRCKVQSLVPSEWVRLVLTEPTGRSRLTQDAKWAVNQASINQTDVTVTAVPLPPLSEQTIILEFVFEKLSQIDALESEITRGLARAGRLRQAILKAAFEGKLVRQDPSDEPASVLLDRIHKQAADAPKPRRSTKKKSTRKAATR